MCVSMCVCVCVCVCVFVCVCVCVCLTYVGYILLVSLDGLYLLNLYCYNIKSRR